MKALLVPFPSIGLIFAGRGQVVSGCLATTLGSRLGTNTKLLRGIVGPVSTPNDYLNTVFDEVVSLRRSFRYYALPRSPREKPQFVAILSRRVKSLSLQGKNMLFVDRLVK